MYEDELVEDDYAYENEGRVVEYDLGDSRGRRRIVLGDGENIEEILANQLPAGRRYKIKKMKYLEEEEYMVPEKRYVTKARTIEVPREKVTEYVQPVQQQVQYVQC